MESKVLQEMRQDNMVYPPMEHKSMIHSLYLHLFDVDGSLCYKCLLLDKTLPTKFLFIQCRRLEVKLKTQQHANQKTGKEQLLLSKSQGSASRN